MRHSAGDTVRRSMLAAFLGGGCALASHAAFDLPVPPGSRAFGTPVVLPNGNIVVIDVTGGPVPNAGAVHLFHASGNLITTLTGDSEGDLVGSGGVFVVGNGHFIVHSPGWDDGGNSDVGAVTWVDGNSGRSGFVAR